MRYDARGWVRGWSGWPYWIPYWIAAAGILVSGSVWGSDDAPTSSAWRVEVDSDWPVLQPVPEGVTSFGAAGWQAGVYLFGGHTGSPHQYSQAEQSRSVQCLDLDRGEWSNIEGPEALQGMGMAAHAGRLWVVGGLAARNPAGQAAQLESQASVWSLELASGQWTQGPALPERRSSHDIALLGDFLYVIGGWQLSLGDEPAEWLQTVWRLDVRDPQTGWQAVQALPSARRAVAVAAHGGELYVIGGMSEQGQLLREVTVYNPQEGKWREVASLPDVPLAGFGAAAVSQAGSLVASGHEGEIWRLADDASRWEVIGSLDNPRFFHRLVPLPDGSIVAIGGWHRDHGKVEMIDRFRLQRS
jgi:hypothetical protein